MVHQITNRAHCCTAHNTKVIDRARKDPIGIGYLPNHNHLTAWNPTLRTISGHFLLTLIDAQPTVTHHSHWMIKGKFPFLDFLLICGTWVCQQENIINWSRATWISLYAETMNSYRDSKIELDPIIICAQFAKLTTKMEAEGDDELCSYCCFWH